MVASAGSVDETEAGHQEGKEEIGMMDANEELVRRSCKGCKRAG